MGGRAHRVADRALTAGAVLGVLALLGTALGMALGVRPMFFRSGSMAPTIGTGAMALARDVPARDLRVGDVVSVTTPAGVRVTHRVVSAEPSGDHVVLTLRGDANQAVDPESYVVGSAYRVFWHVPWLGYAVGSVRTTAGLVLLALVGATVVGTRRRRPPVGGRRMRVPAGSAGRHATRPPSAPRSRGRRARGAGAAAVVTVASMAGPTGSASAAPWTDQVPVTAGYAAHVVRPPDSTTCSASTPSVTIGWPEKDGRYDYEVQLKDGTGSVVSTRQVTGAGVSETYTGASDFGLVVLALGTFDYTVEIRSYLATTTGWRGATVHVASQTIRVSVVLVVVPVLGSIACV